MRGPLPADDLHSRVLGDWLRTEASAIPNRRFVRCSSDWLTLRELDEGSERLAAGLQQSGVMPGDRVAILLPNRVEYILLVYAIAKSGAVQVPINTYLRGEFLRHQLSESGASLIVTDETGLEQTMHVLPSLPLPNRALLVGKGRPGSSSDRSLKVFGWEEALLPGRLWSGRRLGPTTCA